MRRRWWLWRGDRRQTRALHAPAACRGERRVAAAVHRRKERMAERLLGGDALVGVVAKEASEENVEVLMLREDLQTETCVRLNYVLLFE